MALPQRDVVGLLMVERAAREGAEQAFQDEAESAAQDLETYRRTEQGLQMKIADLLRENGMLKNELRAQAGVIERMRNRTL